MTSTPDGPTPEAAAEMHSLIREWLMLPEQHGLRGRGDVAVVTGTEAVGTDMEGSTEGGFYDTFSVMVTWADGDGAERETEVAGEDMQWLWRYLMTRARPERSAAPQDAPDPDRPAAPRVHLGDLAEVRRRLQASPGSVESFPIINGPGTLTARYEDGVVQVIHQLGGTLQVGYKTAEPLGRVLIVGAGVWTELPDYSAYLVQRPWPRPATVPLGDATSG